MLELRNVTGNLIRPKQSPLVVDKELPPWVDIVAFSSTNWQDAHDRPRQVMTRCAKTHRVFYFQEPVYDAFDDPYLELSLKERVNVVIPHLRAGDPSSERHQEKLIGLLLSLAEIHRYIFWYFSPFAVEYTDQFSPRCTIYDCMNEPLSLRNMLPEIYDICKQKLTLQADLVFTTDLGMCLNSSRLIKNIHLFADAAKPKVEDWDRLWQEMSRLIQRTWNRIPPLRTLDPGT